MKLRKATRQNIVGITGISFCDLLNHTPARERGAYVKGSSSTNRDDLVRGNPQLTMGYVTTMEEVETYFEKKVRSTHEYQE